MYFGKRIYQTIFVRFLDSFNTPAPGTYSPEQVHPQGERHAPAHSMGSRTRYRQHDNVPSPNCYSLPNLLGSKVPELRCSSVQVCNLDKNEFSAIICINNIFIIYFFSYIAIIQMIKIRF